MPALLSASPAPNHLAVPADDCGSVCFSHASIADFIPIIKILLC